MIVKHTLPYTKDALSFAPPVIKSNKEVIVNAIEHNGLSLRHAHHLFRNDSKIV